jgi:hypothetical protein
LRRILFFALLCSSAFAQVTIGLNVTVGGNVTVVGGGGGGATFAQGWTAINGGTSFEAANVAVNVAAGAWAKTITGGTSCDATNGNAKEIFYTYSGGWIDTVNQYVALWGGGHNGYGGNEVYVMHYPDGAISRLTDPSVGMCGCQAFCTGSGQPTNYGTYDAPSTTCSTPGWNGTTQDFSQLVHGPPSVHSYFTMEFMPARNQMMHWGGYTNSNTTCPPQNNATVAWILDMSTTPKSWLPVQLTGSPTMADPSSPNLGWDATNNRMYVHTEARGGYWTLSGSNPIVGTWTQVSAAYNGTFNSIISTAYDWTDRVYMVVDSYDVANSTGSNANKVFFHGVDSSGGFTNATAGLTGCSSFSTVNFRDGGITWNSDDNKFYLWSAHDPTHVHTIQYTSGTTATCTLLTPTVVVNGGTGTGPIAPHLLTGSGTGLHKRFAKDPNKHYLLLWPDSNQPPWALCTDPAGCAQ